MTRNPRAEAVARLGGRYEARVLEPSPPAVNAPPWFADDPVARGDVPPDRQVVAPVATGDLRWEELARDDPELAAWCEDRWLGPHRRLGPVPPGLEATRLALHELAEHTISPERQRANGKIGLRHTFRGFGTPFFGQDEQVRVEGTDLVTVRGDEEERRPVDVDPAAAALLADWYGYLARLLEELRATDDSGEEPSRVQLWPEHFDMAVDVGAGSGRATIGGSPGDEHHPEPYLYVLPLAPAGELAGELWQATGFPGAELAYETLLRAADQGAAGLEFARTRLAALAAA